MRFLRESYRPGETLGTRFRPLLCARLFGPWGVILLDASDAELHRVAAPIYRAAIERAEELDAALLGARPGAGERGLLPAGKSDGVVGAAFRDAARARARRSTAGLTGRIKLRNLSSGAKPGRRSFPPPNCWIASLRRPKTSVPNVLLASGRAGLSSAHAGLHRRRCRGGIFCAGGRGLRNVSWAA